MWWALQTVTTVGYGDVVPQDSVARAIASFLLLGGLALLSVVTAVITSGVVARAQRETGSDVEAELLAEIRQLRAGRRARPAPRAVSERAAAFGPSGASCSCRAAWVVRSSDPRSATAAGVEWVLFLPRTPRPLPAPVSGGLPVTWS